jgi:hypothetical protein
MDNFESQRGSELIVYKKYSCVVLRKNNNSVRWKCTQNIHLKCLGKVTTNLIKPVSYNITSRPVTASPVIGCLFCLRTMICRIFYSNIIV